MSPESRKIVRDEVRELGLVGGEKPFEGALEQCYGLALAAQRVGDVPSSHRR